MGQTRLGGAQMPPHTGLEGSQAEAPDSSGQGLWKAIADPLRHFQHPHWGQASGSALKKKKSVCIDLFNYLLQKHLMSACCMPEP